METKALGFIAGFTGDGLEKGLREMGLTTDFIRVEQGMTRINAKVKAAEETEINGMGPVITEEDMAKLTTDEEIVECAGKLQEMGGRNILVSMAGAGALLLDEDGVSHRIGCPSGTVVNSVGAGDSMVAGFLAGYLRSGGDYGYALKLGTAAGSATAFSLRLGSRELIEDLFAAL